MFRSKYVCKFRPHRNYSELCCKSNPSSSKQICPLSVLCDSCCTTMFALTCNCQLCTWVLLSVGLFYQLFVAIINILIIRSDSVCTLYMRDASTHGESLKCDSKSKHLPPVQLSTAPPTPLASFKEDFFPHTLYCNMCMDQMLGGKGTDDKQQTAPCVPKSKHLPQHHPDLFWSDNAKSSPAENNPENEICPHTMENHPAACLWSNASGCFLFVIWVVLVWIGLYWVELVCIWSNCFFF